MQVLLRASLVLALALLQVSAALAAEVYSRDALAGADYFAGKRTFTQRCGACHTLADNSNHLVGPNLYGVFERGTGSADAFGYSTALRAVEAVWTPATMAQFVADPAGYLPGNKMLIPEGVPPAQQLNLMAFMMVETGAADWPRPELPANDPALNQLLPVSERFPSFWNHMMLNTTRYRMVTAESELIFRAYFNPDGSVTSGEKSIRGFWHVDDRDFFCYALYGIPLSPAEFVECFPVAVMAIPRFAEELWVSKPAPGVELHGGIMAGRP
jgi:cytochrome c2